MGNLKEWLLGLDMMILIIVIFGGFVAGIVQVVNQCVGFGWIGLRNGQADAA